MPADAVDFALLDARAKRLAAPAHVDLQSRSEAYLSFLSHGERFALQAALVCGAFRYTEFAPLPGFSPEVLGVTIWRGSFLRVLDLQRIVDVVRPGLDDRAMIVAVGEHGPSFGLLVSSLIAVGPLPEREGALPEREQRRMVRRVTADAVQILDGAQMIRTYAQE